MKTLFKVRCVSAFAAQSPDHINYLFSADYAESPENRKFWEAIPKNRKFWEATPMFSMTTQIKGPKIYETGKVYNLTIEDVNG